MLKKIQLLLNAAATLLIPIGVWAALFHAPREVEMGEVQRIFYVHVPSAIVMMLLFVAAGVLSLIYLFRSRPALDRVAASCADTGILLAFIVLTTGPVWGRKAWGSWWTFEPRLNLTLLTLFVFLGYMALRRFGGGGMMARRLSAAVAALALPAVYFIHYALKLFPGGNHPPNMARGGYTDDPDMALAFDLCFAAVAAFGAAFTLLRLRMRAAAAQLDTCWHEAQDKDLDLRAEERSAGRAARTTHGEPA